ncbi:MAG: hypothetical protein B7Y41_12295 [Hydrogenophilales bacterium 28-61-23]|nr:MAG: hypothetical protein B7Y41_12295 [Hydrogenophilales bacterium 28-61-23]
MAEHVVTQDELALRRRARRRLVGAVAIALTTIVVLPMLFDSEPKPLGPEVDINIPAKDAPFEAAPAPMQPEHDLPVEAKPAEPTQPPAPVSDEAKFELDKAKTVAGKAEAGKVAASKTATAAPALNDGKAKLDKQAQPVAAAAAEKPKLKTEPKSEAKSEAKPTPEAKPTLKPDSPFAAQGYFLQLGAFGSESNASQLKAKASAAGFKAVMTSTNGQFRVRVGPIRGHESALELQAKLKAKGFSPVLLGP